MRAHVVVAVLVLAVSCGRSGPAPVRDGAGPPARFVGVTADGSVVLARTADGSVESRILASGEGVHRDRLIQLLDDGRTLYVWTGEHGQCGSLVRASVDGGAAVKVLDRVRAWSVSGDGRTLAYTDGPYIDPGCNEPLTVVVRDLADEKERRWTRRLDPDGYPAGVAALHWVRAPRYLDWVSCGADSCGPAIIDTERTGTLDEVTTYGPSDDDAQPVPGLGIDWFPASIAMRASRGTIVFSVEHASPDGTEGHPIAEADAMTQRAQRVLFQAPGRPLDFDATGTYLLFEHDERLSWWGGGDRLVPIADGFISATW